MGGRGGLIVLMGEMALLVGRGSRGRGVGEGRRVERGFGGCGVRRVRKEKGGWDGFREALVGEERLRRCASEVEEGCRSMGRGWKGVAKVGVGIGAVLSDETRTSGLKLLLRPSLSIPLPVLVPRILTG